MYPRLRFQNIVSLRNGSLNGIQWMSLIFLNKLNTWESVYLGN